MMEEGRIRVNGQVVMELGVRVDPDRDIVELDGRRVSAAPLRWIAFHKPVGALMTRRDPHGGRTIYDILPADVAGLRYVGRLDRDAEGLLLLTNDGDLAQAIQHPSGGIEREYWVEASGVIRPEAVQKLRSGVSLDDGIARAKRVQLLDAGPIVSHAHLVLTEGRKREVRRMMSAVGHPVMRLRRVRFGPVLLGDLRPGAWRDLGEKEVEQLRRSAAR